MGKDHSRGCSELFSTSFYPSFQFQSNKNSEVVCLVLYKIKGASAVLISSVVSAARVHLDSSLQDQLDLVLSIWVENHEEQE